MAASTKRNGRYLSTAEAAELLNVRVETILRWRKQGKLPDAGTLPGGAYRFSLVAVEGVLLPGAEDGEIGREATVEVAEAIIDSAVRQVCK